MKEIDLIDVWKKDDQKSKSFFDNIAPELETYVRKRSSDLLAKIKRNVWIEIIITFMSVPLLFFIDTGLPNFGFLIALLLLIYIVVLFPYISFFKNINQIQSKDVLNNLKVKRDILKRFLLRVKIIFRILLPLALILGLYFKASKGNLEAAFTWDLSFLLITGVILLAIPILDWFINKTYYWNLYGKHIEVYEKMIESLEQEN